jgi:hypothetical protein
VKIVALAEIAFDFGSNAPGFSLTVFVGLK